MNMTTTMTTVRSMALLLSLAAGQAFAFQPEPAAPAAEVRKVLDGPPTKLAFKQASVEELVAFIVAATGKVVMPQQDVLSRRVTVLSDQPIPRAQALDMVYQALQQNGVAVVESPTSITLRDMAELNRQDIPVLGPNDTTLLRTDLGTMAQKVFALNHNGAKNMGEVLKGAVPDFAKLAVDEASNQISVIGNIALLQRIERLVVSLDRPAAGALQSETFRLRFADAEAIKTNIEELFGEASARSSGNNNNNRNNGGGFFRFPGQQNNEGATAPASSEVRVSANSQQNAVTVVADPAVLEQIREQIDNHWDKELPKEAVVPKVYDLKNSDPVKVRDLLEGLFGRASGGAARTGQANQGGNQAGNTSTGSSQGVGRLAGQFSFQAIPEASRLVVVAKSVDNLTVIDKIIEDLDQPQTQGLPTIIELKHASAEDLAEQLNALLAQDGTLAQVRRAESGLSANSSNISPFSSSAATSSTTASSGNDDAVTPDTLSFWWQRSRPPTDRRPSSALISQVRIVPVWRQNALMVAAPPEYRESITQLINQLDKPGRQVLIAAIVAEVSSTDALNLGLRWSSQQINPSNPDNSIGVGSNATGTRNGFAGSIFDTSVLNANANLNLLLQALAQNQGVSILSEPRIFTADNQEAEFFDGQDVSVPTNSQTTDVGTVTQTFDYRAVGIQMRVRPRITVQGDVDLRVNLQLSSIGPDRGPNESFIFDRRQTTTQLIVKDRQTIVISGILRKEESDIVRKVPLLGDIPLLGYLFKSRDKETVNTELLVFVTPIVVNNTEALDDMNKPFQQRLDQLRDQLKDVGPATPAPKKTEPTPSEDPAAASASAASSDNTR